MIVSGKSLQSFASETINPFLNRLLLSDDEAEVKETLDTIKTLIDSGVDGSPFLELKKILYHNNSKIAHNTLDILRKISPDDRWRKVEVQKDVWKSMYPFFYDRAFGAPQVALNSLKIIEGLIEYNIIDDYTNLQKVLLHESNDVAHLALDILRKDLTHAKQKRKEPEYVEREHIERKPVEKQPRQKNDALENRIRDVLMKNPKYAEVLEEVKSKYKTE
ncbi:MAG: hypothetical protein PHU34_04820 [Candidatus Methanoperedens sp.]|nr:hypothetical protein [Candidatus Methanoperedens sp.]